MAHAPLTGLQSSDDEPSSFKVLLSVLGKGISCKFNREAGTNSNRNLLERTSVSFFGVIRVASLVSKRCDLSWVMSSASIVEVIRRHNGGMMTLHEISALRLADPLLDQRTTNLECGL